MTDASERKRLIRVLRNLTECGVLPSHENVRFVIDMLRADAETIQKLNHVLDNLDVNPTHYITLQEQVEELAKQRNERDEQLAAQSAEVERAKKYLREIRRDPLQTRAFWREIDELTATPSAAGGEKEGG